MNDATAPPRADAAALETSPTVDASNPWLGLASFTEETRAYFFGRDEEIAELARRVQRKLLTLLFGQSGLGKTSILRAGLVPRLRGQGYCPIYVRIAYGREAPEPAEQIKQAIVQSAQRSGHWTQAGVAAPGESLWEFLHHRDDVLRDASGATLIPLLIFDQFEEIFTLAQSDEFGRARAARFICELADLVENRPPKAFEARLEEDESAAERFDFARSDYRVLIALREDYLAPLESLKKDIPSISQNRLRLAPMTGTQALAAVLKPGAGLVSEEVAAAIVRFVAGGAELANAVVEPSLLSLICRELNDARLAQGRSEISLDLLAGSHATILSNFYERALVDQPPAVRRIVEDDLLTESGFRENVAEERLVSRFTEAGAAPNTLATLVNRRLLRIEERLDVRRVELTHDVLCAVVKSSRDQRHEREAREATERLLAEQRERELAARRALVRARQIAAACTLLALLAVGAAVLAYFSGQRAHRAERQAQETRAQADRARGQAEQLLGYLAVDFARELESFGRLNVLAEFSKRQIDYFHGLPAALRGSETVRNGALALVAHARALRWLGDLKGADADTTEALQLLEGLRTGGDHSESTAVALGLAYLVKAQVLDNRNDAGGPDAAAKSAALLQPLATSPQPSVAARRAYVETLVRQAFERSTANQFDAAVRSAREAQRIATELGARDLSNIDMGAYYAEAGAWLVGALISQGHRDEARRAGEDSVALADQVLERRPGFRLALHAEQVILSGLAAAAREDLNPLGALRPALRGEEVSLTLLKLDPNNVISMNNLGSARGDVGDSLWGTGRLQEALVKYQQQMQDLARATTGGPTFFMVLTYTSCGLAYRQAQIGDAAAATATLAALAPYRAQLRRGEPPGSMAVAIVDSIGTICDAAVAFERNDMAAARRIAAEAVGQLQTAKPVGDIQIFQTDISRYLGLHILGRANYELKDFTAAEHNERDALKFRQAAGGEGVGDRRDMGEVSTWIAMTLARQGRLAEAARAIAPVVKFQRELAARNHGDRWQPLELAAALYAEALSEPDRSPALLREAATLLDALPAEIRGAYDARQWRARVREALQSDGRHRT
jgi:hypothetical protein